MKTFPQIKEKDLKPKIKNVHSMTEEKKKFMPKHILVNVKISNPKR